MANLSDQDMGGGLHVVADSTGNVVLEKRFEAGRPSLTVRHTVTDIGALMAALDAARSVISPDYEGPQKVLVWKYRQIIMDGDQRHVQYVDPPGT